MIFPQYQALNHRKTANLFKYVWPFREHQALKGWKVSQAYYM